MLFTNIGLTSDLDWLVVHLSMTDSCTKKSCKIGGRPVATMTFGHNIVNIMPSVAKF